MHKSMLAKNDFFVYIDCQKYDNIYTAKTAYFYPFTIYLSLTGS